MKYCSYLLIDLFIYLFVCFIQSSDTHLYFTYVKTMYTVGYTISLISLSIAITIFCLFRWETSWIASFSNPNEDNEEFLTLSCLCSHSFRKLHCTRNYIHIQLFISFILRAIFIFIRDALLFANEDIHHCDYYPVPMDQQLLDDIHPVFVSISRIYYWLRLNRINTLKKKTC